MANLRKLLSLALALIMLLGLVPAMAESTEPTYTYNTYMPSTPNNWNPHSWEVSHESDLRAYVELPLVSATIAEDGVNFEWTYEGADAVTDITADFADKEAWGIPADATDKYVYQVDLNKYAMWEDGTPINADTYIYSMKVQLDPAMKNYRANSYFDAEVAIKNAANYYNGDKVGQPILKSLEAAGFESVADAQAAGKENFYVDMDGFWGLDAGVVSITDETPYRDEAVEEGKDEDYVSAKYLYETYLAEGAPYESYAPEYMFCEDGVYEATTWEEVGLVKTGEYQFLYICENACSEFDMLVSFGSPWIVYEPLYEAGKKTVENLVATDYGTSQETYMSAGPYKMVSFEKDKQIVLERNENWAGNFDGRHEGQYQATSVKIDIIAEHNTALMLFNQGQLDYVELESNDLPTYRMSDNILKQDTDFTFRWIFATSLESLKALEEQANDGGNKQILSYKDFRKALSLSMDRAAFCAQATPAFKPAYYLYNSLYYYNIAEDANSIYRNTDVAMNAVLNLYGIEYGEGKTYATITDAYNAVTGYDVEEARALFQSVYEQAIADGRYTDGQAINITAMVSSAAALTPDDTKQQDMMNAFVADATKGTGLEGKITFNFLCGAPKRYDDVAAGRYEMIRGAWGGAIFYPFSSIRTYTEPDYMGGVDKIHESNGWDPTKATLDVTYDFDGDGTAETVTDTFQNWAKSINGGGKYYAMPEFQLRILSALETGVLEAYQCIPWGVEASATLYSQKVQEATDLYNVMYAYGEIRLRTFNYSDAQWAEYVASQGGQLNYE